MASNTKKSRSQGNNRTSKSKTSKTTGTRTSNASRTPSKKSSTKKGTGTASQQPQPQNNALRDEIILLLAFACTIILLLSNFNMAGMVGQSIKWFMFGLFGIAAYIIPFIVAGSILFMLANKDIIGVMRIKAAAVYVLSVITAAIWQRMTNKPDIGDSVGSYFTYCSEHKTGGGLFGGILCKILSPLGMAGTMVILIILAIICVILITEKSFIGGLRNGGHRLVKEAREDYSAYREHSSMSRKDSGMSDEEYRAMRENEKHQARIRRLEKKEQIIAAKKAKEEAMANARMNNVVRGVTKDLTIQDTQPETANQDIDIHEIQPVANDDDVYMDDIYDPLIIPEKHNNINRTSDIWEVHSDRQDNDNTALDHGMSYDETISTREDDYEEHDTEYPDEKEKELTEYDPEVSEEYNADIYDTADEGNIYNEKNVYNDADAYDTEEICDTADDINHDENITSYDNDEVSSAGSTQHNKQAVPQKTVSNIMPEAARHVREYKFPPVSLLNRNTT